MPPGYIEKPPLFDDVAPLSPARSALAQLHVRREQLRAEAAPINERLTRIDAIIANAAETKAHVAELSAQFSAQLELALTEGAAIPAKSAALLAAEQAALIADEHRAAAARAREYVSDEVQAMGAQLGALAQEVATATLRVIEEHVEDSLRGAPACAWLAAQREFSPYTGVAEVLRARGASDTQAWQAADRIEKAIRAATSAKVGPDTSAARTFITALDSDPHARLIDGNGVSVSNSPSPSGTTSEGEAAHPGANTAMGEVRW